MQTQSFEDILARDGVLVYTAVGVSMMPLIRQRRDVLTIERVEGRLKPLDVALYRRDDGKCVLHRVLEVREHDYVICGDNQWRREYGITDRHILGRLAAIRRDGVLIRMDDPAYLRYVHRWCDHFWLRAYYLWLRDFPSRLHRLLHRILHR